MTDLFPSLPVSLSPFAKWKHDNCIIVHLEPEDDEDEPWRAYSSTDCARGDTAEDACLRLAHKLGIPWIHGEVL